MEESPSKCATRVDLLDLIEEVPAATDSNISDRLPVQNVPTYKPFQVEETTENEKIIENIPDPTTNTPEATPALPQLNFRRINFTNQRQPTFLTVKVVINEKETEALLDTGARMCLITASEAESLGVTINSLQASEIYGIGGKKETDRIRTRGTIMLDIRIAQMEFNQVKFHVVEDSHIDYSMYIEWDFLRKN